MKKAVTLCYGIVAYLAFFATILYMIGFTGNFFVPKDINSGIPAPLGEAIAVNLALILAFGVQHSVMARPAFKQRWTRIVPKPVERSTFVLVSSLILAATFYYWRPMTDTVWSVEHPAGRAALVTLFALGWGLVFYSSFLINHFDLFGLRQVFLYLRNRSYTPVPVKVVSLYKLVRNPLMLGFLVALWATPLMTAGHLLFALGMSAYIFVGIYFEERTLARELGPVYQAYRARTPMILPLPRGGHRDRAGEEKNEGLALAGEES